MRRPAADLLALTAETFQRIPDCGRDELVVLPGHAPMDGRTEQPSAYLLRDGQLLAGSSGNLSGQGNSYRPEELAQSIIDGVDLFIDHGVARHENAQRMATTMIDLRTLEVTRRGVNYNDLQARLAECRAAIGGK